MTSAEIAAEQVDNWKAAAVSPCDALKAMGRPTRGGWDAVFVAVMIEAERMQMCPLGMAA